MKILVADKFNQPRDMAMMDMYSVIGESHQLIYADEKTLHDNIRRGNYDLLWLGIYHHVMEVPWNRFLKYNRKPVIIDQCDNEEFMTVKIEYSLIGEKKLLSRYLPNKIQAFWKEPVYLLPWYINPERFTINEKTLDFSFVATIEGDRIGINRVKLAERFRQLGDESLLAYYVGTVFGGQYRDILSVTKELFIECERRCLTQKYIEGALSGCLLTGHVPLYPANELKVQEFDFQEFRHVGKINREEAVKFNREYILRTFASKEYFMSHFNKLI